MVAELARAIVNRASQLWNATVLMHRWMLNLDLWLCNGLHLWLATGNDSDNEGDIDDVVIMATKYQVREVRRKNPHFREWSGEVEAGLTTHEFHTEDYMDESARSVEAIDIRNTQNSYVEEDTQFRDNRYPIVPTEDETDELEDYKFTTIIIHLQGLSIST
eukprot:59108-Amphidinium_carterae.1